MADTLLGVAQEELDKTTKEQGRAQNDLAASQADLAQAQQDLAAASADLSALQDDVARIRRQIAETTIAADGKKLFDDLDAKRTKLRARQADALDAQERAAEAASRIGAAQDELSKTATDARAAQTAKDAATRADADATTWAAAATGALAALPAQADVAVPGAAKTAADAAAARLDGAGGGDVPAELFTRAKERRQQRAARLKAAADAARAAEDRLAVEGAKAGLAGTAGKAELQLDRSTAAVRDFALTGQQDYDRALALLAGVVATPKLNADENARIADLHQGALNADAYHLEQLRDQAQQALDTQRDAVMTAYLDALATDPTDPADVKAVEDEKAKLKALEDAVTAAQKNLDPVQAKLDAVEAAVPDPVWRAFDDQQEALALLTGVHAVDPAAIKTKRADDEDAYAKALRTEQDNARAVLAVGELAKQWDDRAATVSQTAPSRLLEALRGDG